MSWTAINNGNLLQSAEIILFMSRLNRAAHLFVCPVSFNHSWTSAAASGPCSFHHWAFLLPTFWYPCRYERIPLLLCDFVHRKTWWPDRSLHRIPRIFEDDVLGEVNSANSFQRRILSPGKYSSQNLTISFNPSPSDYPAATATMFFRAPNTSITSVSDRMIIRNSSVCSKPLTSWPCF